LTVCDARAHALDGGRESLVATMTGTLMAIMPRSESGNVEGEDRAVMA
jgi:hypothetical protein